MNLQHCEHFLSCVKAAYAAYFWSYVSSFLITVEGLKADTPSMQAQIMAARAGLDLQSIG